jgi:hypothetical protein
VTGNATAGNLITAGNVSGAYLFGNGSQLTGLPATYSDANVATFLAAFGSNTISTTGNVTSSNVVIPNGGTTGLFVNDIRNSSNSDNSIVFWNFGSTAYADVLMGNLLVTNTGLNQYISTTGNVIAGDRVSATNVVAQGTLSSNGNVVSVGNIDGGNLRTAGQVSATGNIITAGNFVGNGAALTGIAGTYSNTNATSLLASFGSNTISTTGNISGGYLFGNGSQLTGVVATSIGVLTSLSVTGNIDGGNLRTAGQVTATGNIITAGNFVGNGAALTGISGTYSNTNATSLLASFGSNTISTTGNITGSNINASTVQATGSGGLSLKNSAGTTQASLGAGGGDNFAINVSTNLNGNNAQIDISPTGTGHVHIKPTGTGAVEIAPTSTGSMNNMVIGNVTPAAVSATTVSATGNITGANINGNGSGLSSITGANVSGTVANATYATNAGAATSATTAGTVTNATQGNITAVGVLTSLSSTGNITGANINGNGSGLSSLTGANVTGTVANATYATNAGAATTATTATSATTAGTVTTATQGNITAVGTLTSLNVTGNVAGGNLTTAAQVSAAGNITGSYFIGNGSQLTGIAASSYGNANVVSLLAGFGSNTISTTGNISGGNLNAAAVVTSGLSGNISGVNYMNANYYTGNGSLLTGLPANYGNANVATLLAGFGSNTVSTTGNITAGNFRTAGTISATGNIIGGNLTGTLTTAAQTNIQQLGTLIFLDSTGNLQTTANVIGGNVISNGKISSAGNIDGGGSIIVAGSIEAIGSRANVGSVSATGNVNAASGIFGYAIGSYGGVQSAGNITTDQYFIGNGAFLTGVVSSNSNIETTAFSAASFFVGDGSLLTNISDGTTIVNGNSNVSIATANGNIVSTVNNSAVSTVTAAGVSVTGTVSATGNITGNYFLGNGSALTGVTATEANSAVYLRSASTANANISINDTFSAVILPGGGTISYLGNFDPATYGSIDLINPQANIANAYSALTFLNASNLFANPINTLFVSNASAFMGYDMIGSQKLLSIDAAGVTTNTTISATGNITGNYFLGNGSALTGVTASSANAATYLTAPTNPAAYLTVDDSTTQVLLPGGSSFYYNGNGDPNTVGSLDFLTMQANIANSYIAMTSANLANLEATPVNSLYVDSNSVRMSYDQGNDGPQILLDSTGIVVTGGNILALSIQGSDSTTGVELQNYKDVVHTITYASTITPNIALGSIQEVTLTGNVTMNAFGGAPQAGQNLTIKFIQDSTGNRTLSSTMLWAGGAKTLSTAGNAVDIATVFYDGTTYYATLNLDYS